MASKHGTRIMTYPGSGCLGCNRLFSQTVPSAAYRPDKIHRGMSALAVELDGNPPLLKHHAIGVDDIQIADRPFAILYLRKLRRPGRRHDGGILDLRLLAQYTQAG